MFLNKFWLNVNFVHVWGSIYIWINCCYIFLHTLREVSKFCRETKWMLYCKEWNVDIGPETNQKLYAVSIVRNSQNRRSCRKKSMSIFRQLWGNMRGIVGVALILNSQQYRITNDSTGGICITVVGENKCKLYSGVF